jgi:hypothetical protein
MFYLPPGSMMQLMDGRVLHKDQKTNLWHDNMGVPITEQQLHFMVSFPSFSDDPSGGDNATVPVAAASDTVVSLSAPFDDIVINDGNVNTTVFNTNRTIITNESPVTLRVTFNGTTNSGTVKVYKNDVEINTIRTTISSSGLVTTLTGTFADGDQLKFSYIAPNTSASCNFDVTLEKTAPGATSVLDVFNIAAAFSVGGGED